MEEKEIPYSEIKKGFEIEKTDYVVIEKNDLRSSKKLQKSIDIKEFVDSKELDPIIIEKKDQIAPDIKEVMIKLIRYLSKF